jgi:hypothetical protein
MITSVDLLRQPNYFRFCMFKDYILIETTEVTGTGVNNVIHGRAAITTERPLFFASYFFMMHFKHQRN